MPEHAAQPELPPASPTPPPQVLITGFPGFIARRLLGQLMLAQDDAPSATPGAPQRWALLVLDRMVAAAEASLAELDALYPGLKARCEVIVGDITEPDLGLAPEQHARLTAHVRRVW
ncbi:MAG: SDR family oxidoreductase, partial [Myxococcota bacterium]